MEKEIFEDRENQKQQEYVDSKCPNCGSKLSFVPGTSSLRCESCDSTFSIESIGKGKLDEEEKDYFAMLDKLSRQSSHTKKQRTIKCDACGANFLLNDKTVSTKCPYCGSNRVVVEEKQEVLIKIDGVIPFVFDKEKAKEYFKDWVKHKKMAPINFKKKLKDVDMNGFYVPYYTYDSNTYSSYTAYRGDYYYVTVKVNGKTTKERRVKWTFVSGKVNKPFDDVLVNGIPTRIDKHITKISVFDFNSMEKYQESFIMGYYSERPSISLKEGFDKAKEMMYQDIRRECISRIGGDTYKDLTVNSRFEDVTFKQIMAPIYSGSYYYLNKKKAFVVNGQNGKVSGESPVSVLKVSILVLIILLIVFFILYFILKDESAKYYYDCIKFFMK